MAVNETGFRLDTQAHFEQLLLSQFPFLEPIDKWKQTMWNKEGQLIVSLVFLSQKVKFCFFNNPIIELDKLQRWGSTISSQNLEYDNRSPINWRKVQELIDSTIQNGTK